MVPSGMLAMRLWMVRMVSEGKKPQLEEPRQLMPSALASGAAVSAARTTVAAVKRILVDWLVKQGIANGLLRKQERFLG